MSNEVHSHPQHWKVKFTSNMLLLLFLAVILLNSVVVYAFQVWFVYDLDAPEDALKPYSGSTVLDTARQKYLQSWLLRTEDGALQLVTAEKHVLLEQYRTVKGGTLQISETPFQKTAWGDAALAHITVGNNDRFEHYQENVLAVQITRSMPHIPLAFLLYSILLLVLEIGACLLFRKLRA